MAGGYQYPGVDGDCQHRKTDLLLLKDTQVPKPEWPVEIVGKWRKGKGEVYSILLQFKSGGQ